MPSRMRQTAGIVAAFLVAPYVFLGLCWLALLAAEQLHRPLREIPHVWIWSALTVIFAFAVSVFVALWTLRRVRGSPASDPVGSAFPIGPPAAPGTYDDLLGRMTRTVAGGDGTSDGSASTPVVGSASNQVTDYACDGADHVIAQTAWNNSGTNAATI